MRQIGAELVSVQEALYWKEAGCVQFNVEVLLPYYEKERLKDAVIASFAAEGEIICNESEGCLDLSVYGSMDQILREKKVFFQFYIKH